MVIYNLKKSDFNKNLFLFKNNVFYFHVSNNFVTVYSNKIILGLKAVNFELQKNI